MWFPGAKGSTSTSLHLNREGLPYQDTTHPVETTVENPRCRDSQHQCIFRRGFLLCLLLSLDPLLSHVSFFTPDAKYDHVGKHCPLGYSIVRVKNCPLPICLHIDDSTICGRFCFTHAIRIGTYLPNHLVRKSEGTDTHLANEPTRSNPHWRLVCHNYISDILDTNEVVLRNFNEQGSSRVVRH